MIRRPSPHPQRPGAARERGFALLSVIFFVLALTILGLSLFSLSNYEARFFNPALDRAGAVQAARGGLDWARFVIENTDSLNLVWNGTRPPGLDYAVAWRDMGAGNPPDSVGRAFEEPHKPIWIRAVGENRGQRHEVLARYEIDGGTEIYRRLITAIDRVELEHGSPAENRYAQLELRGRIATPTVRDENDVVVPLSTIWPTACRLDPPTLRPQEDLLGTWWTERYTAPSTQSVDVPFQEYMMVYLDASGSDHRYFRTHEPSSYPGQTNRYVDFGRRRWSLLRDYSAGQGNGTFDSLTIRVAGRAIWMLPEGLKIEQPVTIMNLYPGQEATLILVARPGICTGSPCGNTDGGVEFLGGLDIAGVNVIVASVGRAEIDYASTGNLSGNGTASFLTLYADRVRITPPLRTSGGGNALRLYHGADCASSPPQDGPALMDQLLRKNLLPNSRFARRHLAFDSGTWQETPVALPD